MINQFGIEWLVDGHFYASDCASLARPGFSLDMEDPRDLQPVIIPLNLSKRLNDFVGQTWRCTSKGFLFLDTVPSVRTAQAHAHGHGVDSISNPHHVLFNFDAAHLSETIFAHEVGHVWIGRVEDCEDYRQMRDMGDGVRQRQLSYIQSFVLDFKVNQLIRQRGFDMSGIEADQSEVILSMARMALSGRRPAYKREAATDALFIATMLVEREQGRTFEPSASSIQRQAGDIDTALRVLKERLPAIYKLGASYAASIFRHGYSNKQCLLAAIDDCILHGFTFTDGRFDVDTELEEMTLVEPEDDKFPGWMQGLSVTAKMEVGRLMAKENVVNGDWNVFVAPDRKPYIRFQRDTGEWTEPLGLQHVPGPDDLGFWLGRARPLPGRDMLAAAGDRERKPFHLSSSPPVSPPYTPVSVPMASPSGTPPMPWAPGIRDARSLPGPVQKAGVSAPRQGPFMRSYMPGVGRWMSQARDPLTGEVMSFQKEHPYTYAENNPVNRIDPEGLWSFDSESCSFLTKVQKENLRKNFDAVCKPIHRMGEAGTRRLFEGRVKDCVDCARKNRYSTLKSGSSGNEVATCYYRWCRNGVVKCDRSGGGTPCITGITFNFAYVPATGGNTIVVCEYHLRKTRNNPNAWTRDLCVNGGNYEGCDHRRCQEHAGMFIVLHELSHICGTGGGAAEGFADARACCALKGMVYDPPVIKPW